MMDSIRRNVTLFVGLIAVGLICSQAAGFMTSPRGASGPTMLLAESPAAAITAVLLCLLPTLGISIVVGRVINTAVGLFVLGAGLFVLAHRLSTVAEISRGGGSLAVVAIELVLWSLLILGLTLAMFRFAGPLRDVEADPDGRRPHWLLSREAMISAVAGIAMLPVVWLVAQSTMKGQVIGAVFFGGMLAGTVGRLLSPHVQPILLFVSPCVFGAAGYLIGMATMQGTLGEALVADQIPTVLRPMPIDYAAGSLMGVAVGLGCAKSFLHHEEEGEAGDRATAS